MEQYTMSSDQFQFDMPVFNDEFTISIDLVTYSDSLYYNVNICKKMNLFVLMYLKFFCCYHFLCLKCDDFQNHEIDTECCKIGPLPISWINFFKKVNSLLYFWHVLFHCFSSILSLSLSPLLYFPFFPCTFQLSKFCLF